jgi:ribosomal RNA-processing protein 8
MFAVPGWSVSSSALTQQSDVQSKDQSQGKGASTPNAKKDNKRKRGNDRVTSGNVDEMYRRHIEGNSGSKGGKRGKAGANAGAGASAGAGVGAFAGDSSLKPWEKKKLQKEQQQAAAAGASTETKDVPKTEPEAGQEDGKPAKKQKRNRKSKNKEDQQDKTQEQDVTTPAAEASAPVKTVGSSMPAASATLTPLQQAMRQKLISSRFRHLNETLYTTDSSKAVELFNANPELFDEYHAGFSRQVKESWPSNPVDAYIQTVRRRGAVPVPKRGKPDPSKPLPLPRRPNGACTIADLGCGDAGLARALTPSAKKLNLKLNSYDLQAPDALITKADISNLPLEDGTVDVAIFCLSLMGTNWVSFVEEAWRVLRGDGKGECWVSEVKSRFGKVARKKSQIGAQKPLSKAEQKKQKKKGGKGDEDELDEADIFAEDARPTDNDETDISAFVEVFKSRGFVLKQESLDKSNKMFVKMEFVKAGWTPTKGKHASAAPAPGVKGGKKRFVEKKTDADTGMTEEQEAQVLKPCVYKIR